MNEYTRSNCQSMATLLYDTFTYPSYILIILLKIKCFLQYIYMYIVYSSVAMDGSFTLVKEGGHFQLVNTDSEYCYLYF